MAYRAVGGTATTGGASRAHYTIPGMDIADSPAKLKHKQKAKAVPPATGAQSMDKTLVDSLRARFLEKVNPDKFELVAAFSLDKGVVQTYHVYRRVHNEAGGTFELTERRRRLLHRYYLRGRQTVLLYVNYMQFEHYMPIPGASIAVGSPAKTTSTNSTSTGSGTSFEMSSGCAAEKEDNLKSPLKASTSSSSSTASPQSRSNSQEKRSSSKRLTFRMLQKDRSVNIE